MKGIVSLSVVVLSVFITISSAQDDLPPIAKTSLGDVRGKTINLSDGTKIARWYGVPYAKAPTGQYRWKPPRELDSWEGEYDANTLGPCCTQNGGGFFLFTHPLWNSFDEDCLNMNIYAPENKTAGPYPVLIYFHGGAYISMCNIQYSFHFMAAKGVIVVAANYRIQALGFMSTGDSAAPGNYGLMDQQAVIEYVRQHIEAYGGDPNKITVGGQSAGAASTGIHIVSPKTRGKFHQAIMESGSDVAVWAVNEPVQNPHEYTKQVAAKLECPTDDSQLMMDCLREVPANEIYNTGFDCLPGYFCQGFAPVVDGPDGVLPKLPYEYRKEGDFMKIPTLIGQTHDDGSLYTMILVPESMNGGFTREEFETHLMDSLVGIFSAALPGTDEEVFNALNFYYSQWPELQDPDTNREAMNILITDFGFGFTGDTMIKSQSNFTDVFYYILDYRTTEADKYFPQWMGVPHNGELPYVGGWPLLQQNKEVRTDSKIKDIIRWNDLDIEWANYFISLWANFIKYGDPTAEPVKFPGAATGDSTWPRFKVDEEYKYLYMGQDEILVKKEYRQQNHAFWMKYLPYVANYTFFPDDNIGFSGHPKKVFKIPRKYGPLKKNRSPKNIKKINSHEVMKALNKFWAKAAKTGILRELHLDK